MSCCKTHVKRIDPVTGTAIVYDISDGSVVTDQAIIDALECCPERSSDKEEVCVQPVGNLLPDAIIPGWLISVKEIDAAGTLTILSSKLYDEDLVELAGHEVVACPDSTPIDVPLCLPA